MAIVVTVTIANASEATRVATAFAAKFGVTPDVAGVKSAIANYIKGIVRQYETDVATQAISIIDVVPS